MVRERCFSAFLFKHVLQVQQFGSIPQLLHLTASADLLQISKGMREHSAKLRREAADFWTSMLHRFEALRTASVETEVQHLAASFCPGICVRHRETLAGPVHVDEELTIQQITICDSE